MLRLQCYALSHSRRRAPVEWSLVQTPSSGARLRACIPRGRSQCGAEHQPTSQSCGMHAGSTLHSFCMQCNALLCGVCDHAHTTDHKQSLLPIAEAAAKTSIRTKLSHGMVDLNANLEEKYEALVAAVDSLQSEVE